MKLSSRDVEETRRIGEALAPLLAPGDVVVLAGDLGTGKTALAQGIGRGLGIEEPVTSPSFMIVREYEAPVRLAHVDVYRLDHVQELHDLGFEEVVEEGRITVVEWGDRVGPLLPESRLEIFLRVGAGEHVREIECVARGSGWEGRIEVLEAVLAPFTGEPLC